MKTVQTFSLTLDSFSMKTAIFPPTLFNGNMRNVSKLKRPSVTEKAFSRRNNEVQNAGFRIYPEKAKPNEILT